MPALSAVEGYRRWAPSYARETAISALEDKLVSAMTPPLAARRLLDAGCGVGRRLTDCGAAEAVGVDPSAAMLEAGVGLGKVASGVRTLIGDVHHLPFPDRAFDVVWCRLVLGHLADIERAYAELARVTAAGGTLVVSDFHPAAHAAGHRRTFRDDDGVHEVEHYVHDLSAHAGAARAAGLTPTATREAAIGPDVRDFYEHAGRAGLYAAHLDLPVVLAIAFRREG
ncbi:class I SAM-dependent methyltransferase [Sphingomonas sp.]|jgi:malonyl-CoA O-methyltransferase|uniref:class I SAM-dependent methyltransferase n=1 Tax=Sphingomonas sp. TaxID=28214 RepID=UPI002E2F283B|nr:class I SAM-dependent methyltransferase [Sphingomonas sp.]HEX4695433.1 class I SAM-dependent methyltransferase [Sphingomonas sp.]